MKLKKKTTTTTKNSLYRTKLGKEEKKIVSPSTVDFAVRGGKLGIYTLHNPPKIFLKSAPSRV